MAVTASTMVTFTAACGDGRPAFCDDLAKSATMSALSKALQTQDLDRARTAAKEFSGLADAAPTDIRSQVQDLAGAVSDVVDLLAAERNAVPGAGDDGQGDAAAVEQQRDRLNSRMADLSATSAKVEQWASQQCGIDLR
ncbi:MAG TPA: hypothetical protein PLS63_05975 [Microthrixaceae bacterium]|nr:hypothetical protein [Microthrixaceae bacterium]